MTTLDTFETVRQWCVCACACPCLPDLLTPYSMSLSSWRHASQAASLTAAFLSRPMPHHFLLPKAILSLCLPHPSAFYPDCQTWPIHTQCPSSPTRKKEEEEKGIQEREEAEKLTFSLLPSSLSLLQHTFNSEGQRRRN